MPSPGVVCRRCSIRISVYQFDKQCGCFVVGVKPGQFAWDKNPSWRGGHAGYRGPNWKKQRLEALQRDGFCCRTCGSKGMVSVHHVKPFRLHRDYLEANRLENLLTLCVPCHTKADNMAWKSSLLLGGPRAAFPDCRMIRKCEKCSERFHGTARASRCQKCCAYICEVCGSKFDSRKRREIRFCSKACNVSFRQANAIFPRKCTTCGVKIRTGRYRCIVCHRNDPHGSVAVGKKIGRPPRKKP